MLAANLGREGPFVMNALVSVAVTSAAEQRFPNDVCQRYYYCLTTWCQMKGKEAKLEDLKRVLEYNYRRDLVDLIDQIDAIEQGYETAP